MSPDAGEGGGGGGCEGTIAQERGHVCVCVCYIYKDRGLQRDLVYIG
jgi:hypothetical protein